MVVAPKEAKDDVKLSTALGRLAEEDPSLRVVQDADTGETRIERMCGWTAMPIFLTEVIKASNRPAAAVESTRNEIAAGLAEVGRRLTSGLQRISAAPSVARLEED